MRLAPGRLRMDRLRASKIIERGKMRRRLYEILWEETHQAEGSAITPRPCPYLDGDDLVVELRAIILGR